MGRHLRERREHRAASLKRTSSGSTSMPPSPRPLILRVVTWENNWSRATLPTIHAGSCQARRSRLATAENTPVRNGNFRSVPRRLAPVRSQPTPALTPDEVGVGCRATSPHRVLHVLHVRRVHCHPGYVLHVPRRRVNGV